MSVVSSMFGVGASSGPCLICGAPNSTCVAGSDLLEPRRIDLRRGVPVSPWRSRERVLEADPKTGIELLKYARGVPIPLMEAVRQGIIALEALTQDQRNGLAQHLRTHPDDLETMRAALKKGKGKGLSGPPKDKMVRSGNVTKK